MLKKSILVALLSATPLISIAQNWVFVENSSSSNLYADPKSVSTHGNIVKLKILQDMHRPVNPTTQSFVALEEVDCTLQIHRTLQVSAYDQKMGVGNSDPMPTQSNWEKIRDGSSFKSLMNLICN